MPMPVAAFALLPKASVRIPMNPNRYKIVIGEITSNIPTRQAKPFPPLNLKKILKLCPRMTKNEAKYGKSSDLLKFLAIAIAATAFAASIIKVKIPGKTPIFLIAFTVPTFPLPTLVMSFLAKTFPAIYAEGIEPNI